MANMNHVDDLQIVDVLLLTSPIVVTTEGFILGPYVLSRSKIIPFVHPKPTWTGYSPPVPYAPGSVASY